MTAPAKKTRPATYADLEAAPDHLVAELIGGELILSPRPAPPHVVATSVIATHTIAAFQIGGRGPGGAGPGGWWIMFEPELHFGPPLEVVVPDIAGWRRERMPRPPDTAAFELAPDWICEVLSPSTAGTDRVRKMATYAREGVAHLWLVDPLAHTLEVYRLEGDRWIVASTHAGDVAARAEPFDAVPMDMSQWWLPEEPIAEGGA